jgi:hypothetical protein
MWRAPGRLPQTARAGGLGSSALSNTRSDTFVPKGIRQLRSDHHPPTSVPDDHRHSFVRAGSTPGPFGRLSTALPRTP